jgi:hypothetical protein
MQDREVKERPTSTNMTRWIALVNITLAPYTVMPSRSTELFLFRFLLVVSFQSNDSVMLKLIQTYYQFALFVNRFDRCTKDWEIVNEMTSMCLTGSRSRYRSLLRSSLTHQLPQLVPVSSQLSGPQPDLADRSQHRVQVLAVPSS